MNNDCKPKEGDGAPVTHDNDLSELIRCGEFRSKCDRAYPITSFVLDQVWGGKAFPNCEFPYRAKLGLFQGIGALIAELYFFDLDKYESFAGKNPDADDEFKKYYVLHFPVTALDPIMRQLYFLNHHTACTNAQLLLTWYYKQWCFETTGNTPVIPAKPC